VRVVTAQIGHETNTFSVTPTRLENFRQGSTNGCFVGGEAIVAACRNTRTIHGGFVKAAETAGAEIVPLLSTFATPSGTVEESAYEQLRSMLLTRLEAARPFDAVALDLHGAMVTDRHEDAEGDLIAAVREAVGSSMPIIVTLDLHANATRAMADVADAIIGFDEYPHTDMLERGVEAMNLAIRAARRNIAPTMAYCQLPLLTMPPMQCTLREPMRSLLDLVHDIEERDTVLNATLAMGFPFADIRDAGVAVLVTTDGDQALADGLAQELAREVWRARDAFMPTLTPVGEAIDFARTAPGPVVFADGSDNPGGGGPCDGTVVLSELIASGLDGAVVAVIADPESMDAAIAAGVGNHVDLTLGGKTDDRHGPPLKVRAYVRVLSDGGFALKGAMGAGARASMGKAAVIVVAGVEIVVTQRRIQPFDAELLRSVGIEPRDRRFIALKSAVHFRSTYQEFAHAIFDADTPGVHRPDFQAYDYKKLRRPIYPLDDVAFDPR